MIGSLRTDSAQDFLVKGTVLRRSVTYEGKHDPTTELLVDHFSTAIWILNRVNTTLILESSTDEYKALTRDQYRVATSQVLTAIGTATSIERLLETVSHQAKDAAILSRSFIESVLNAAFILTHPPKAAARANLHKVYYDYRNQVQTGTLGTIIVKIASKSKIDRNHPIVKEAVAAFDPKGSGKAKRMAGLDRQSKIKSIYEDNAIAGLAFFGAEKLIYELASDLAHSEQAALETFESNREDVCFRLVSACFLAIRGLSECLHGRTQAVDLKHLNQACELYFRTVIPEAFSDAEK